MKIYPILMSDNDRSATVALVSTRVCWNIKESWLGWSNHSGPSIVTCQKAFLKLSYTGNGMLWAAIIIKGRVYSHVHGWISKLILTCFRVVNFKSFHLSSSHRHGPGSCFIAHGPRSFAISYPILSLSLNWYPPFPDWMYHFDRWLVRWHWNELYFKVFTQTCLGE